MKILLILLFPFIFNACTKTGDSAMHDGPLQQAKGVIISESQKGDSQWLLKAKEAAFYDNPQTVGLTMPILDFTGQDKATATLTADSGVYDINKNLITMRGNVVGHSPKEATTIMSAQAFYHTKTRQILIDVPVKIVRGGITLNGAGLKAENGFNNIEIIKQQTQLPKYKKDFGLKPDTI